MSEFLCNRCGKCCISLGRHIRLERTLSPFSHVVSVPVTREIHPVQVSPESRDLFLSRSAPFYEQEWCPFLRRSERGVFTCTIYSSRPGICRSFRCCTLRITGSGGKEAGRVKGRRDLETEDPGLRKIWEEEIRPLSSLPDDEFFARCRQVLRKHGYEGHG
jgi:Fe-S-cluster containining protein